jgi:hypothetical protein
MDIDLHVNQHLFHPKNIFFSKFHLVTLQSQKNLNIFQL